MSGDRSHPALEPLGEARRLVTEARAGLEEILRVLAELRGEMSAQLQQEQGGQGGESGASSSQGAGLMELTLSPGEAEEAAPPSPSEEGART